MCQPPAYINTTAPQHEQSVIHTQQINTNNSLDVDLGGSFSPQQVQGLLKPQHIPNLKAHERHNRAHARRSSHWHHLLLLLLG